LADGVTARADNLAYLRRQIHCAEELVDASYRLLALAPDRSLSPNKALQSAALPPLRV
jgi:uncharacterized protein (UPF0303 family)